MTSSLNILFIRTPTIIPRGLVAGYRGIPPLGLAYVMAVTKQAGYHNLSCIDSQAIEIDRFTPLGFDNLVYNGLTPDEVIERISSNVDIIAISCMFSNEWIGTKELCQKIKKSNPSVKIILGGEHATSEYKSVLESTPEIDFCVVGEGEYKFLQLLEFIEGKLPQEELDGIALRKSNDIFLSQSSHYRIDKIDPIPWPLWDLIPMHQYLNSGRGWAVRGKRSMPIIASRGCPYRCSFCSSEKMWTTKWKPRDIKDLINEMKYYIHKYEIEHFDFYDLTAIVNKNWTIEFCKALYAENLNITWSLPAGTRSEALSDEVLHLLKKSGLHKIVYAPESGSERILKLIKKQVDLDKMLKSMKFANQNGLCIKANMVTAFPDEKPIDILYDFILIFRLAFTGIHDLSYFCFAPYPGSAFFDQLIKDKSINRDKNFDIFLAKNVHNSPFEMVSYSKHIPTWSVPYITLGGMSLFYSLQFLFRPIRLFNTIKRLLLGKPITMLELALEGLLQDIKHNKINYWKKT